jgi:polar amino acid transport system permease protein
MDILQSLLTTLEFIIQGLWITVWVTVVALVVGLVFGVLTALMRVYGNRFWRQVATVYSVVIRAIPVVVIIFILFFVIAEYINLSPFLAGSLALGFASGAYQSEIFRGALQAVPPGQMTAARAIGMSKVQAIWSIVLPQACGWRCRPGATRRRWCSRTPRWSLSWGCRRFCGGRSRSARAPTNRLSPLARRCCSTWG